MKQWEEKEKRLNYRAGLAAAVVVNALSSRSAAPVSPLDFFQSRETIEISAEEASTNFALYADRVNAKMAARKSNAP